MIVLPGTERQPHARAVLARAVGTGGAPPDPSHAYLFQGPPGSGKRTVARALAARLLAEPAAGPHAGREPDDDAIAAVAGRIGRAAHPDLTWVRPVGGQMRRDEIDDPVVNAAARRPFEATRRVFVLERAHTLNDTAANRLLKTLEEPPSYVVLILVTDRPGELLPTIRSRCQTVRFDPAPEADLADAIAARNGVDPATALACVRLGLGDASIARSLAAGDGAMVRTAAEQVARHALAGGGGVPPWATMGDAAVARGNAAAAEVEAEAADLAGRLADREAKRALRDGEEAAKRAKRRERTDALDLGLRICGLWFRDVAAVAVGAEGTAHHADRLDALREDAARTDPQRALRCVDLVDGTRRSLRVNATENLQLDALSVRLQEALGRR
ncbi:MAG: ATP-binding protein [Solirubrobacteraceae bacterium]